MLSYILFEIAFCFVTSNKCLLPLFPPTFLSSQTKGKGSARCVTLRPTTKLFACEMADLLIDHPQGLAINKIVPSYKEKFGQDLLVAQYGFPKLIRALEAIQHTIEVSVLALI